MFFSHVKVNQPMNKGIREHVAQIRRKLDEFENMASSGDGDEEEGEERETAEDEEEEEEEEGEKGDAGVWVVATPPDPAVQLQLRQIRNMVELLAQINAALYGRRRRPAVDVRRGADTLDARRDFLGRADAPVHAFTIIQSEGAPEDEEDEDEEDEDEEDEDEEDEDEEDKDEDEDEEDKEEEDKEDVRVRTPGGDK